MPIARRVVGFWRSLRRQPQLDRELDDELRCVVEELTARNRERGMPAGAARRAALVEVGGVEQVKEQVRAARIGAEFETTVRDVRFAWRQLWKTPGFAIVSALTLAFGIGTTAAIFSVVKALLLEPLPYRDADRLVFVWQDLTQAGYPRAPLAGPELLDLRHRSRLFEAFGGIWANTTALTGDGDPEQLRIGLVTSNFFSVLGAEAALGRTFNPDDEASSASPGVVLAWPLFERRFGADPSVVGRRIQLNGRPTTVVGVMPRTFRLLMPPDASVPDDLQAWQLLNAGFIEWPRSQQFLRVVGRMKQGVSLGDAQQEVASIAQQVGREFKEYGSAGATFYAVGLQDDGVREVRPALLALFGGVGLLLLIACVNVAGLLVTRAAARAHETAMRMALGASRGRLFRQCLAEGLVLAALGGAAAVLVAHGSLALLLAMRPAAIARIDAAAIDWKVLGFAAAVALVWGILFSLAPLAELLRTDLVAALQRGERRGGGDIQYRTRAALVVAQIALGIVLLVGAGLLVRGFMRLQQVDAGFSSDNVLTFRIALSGARYRSADAGVTFARALREKLAAIPGARASGAISHLPYDELPNWGGPYLPEGKTDPAEARAADTRSVMPGYFESVGATLLQGRFFTEADTATSEPVAIIDQRLAERTWPRQLALGRRMLADPFTSGSPNQMVKVVGIVKHIRHRRPTEETNEQIYFPWPQAFRNPMAYVVKTTGDPTALAASVREIVGELDPQLPVSAVRPLDAYVGNARATRRFTAMLAACFAGIALLLACIGVYGVTSYSVTLRRHEFGVRVALGARRAEVMQLVLRECAWLTLAGAVLGGAGSAVAAMLMKTQLFGVTPSDPVTYAIAIPVIGLAALLACWIPARRATRISPLEALRN
jgi:putative ABC transport system permease protein